MAQQEVNRQQSGIRSAAVLASSEAMVAFLREEIAKTQRLVQEQGERSAQLKQQLLLLCSIPGVGAWTAARVLAESDEIRGAVDARQLAASAGLTPRERTSGSSVHRGPPPTTARQDRQDSLTPGTLYAGHRRAAAQPSGTCPRGAAAYPRQTPAGDRRGGDA
jgi:transposase